MSLAFLYNVASCIAYALVSAAYGSLYYVERRRGYLFVALIFLSSNLSRYHRSPGLVPAISKRRYRE